VRDLTTGAQHLLAHALGPAEIAMLQAGGILERAAA